MKMQLELRDTGRSRRSLFALTVVFLFVAVLAGSAGLCRAALIIDDDFTGTASGIPPGWTRATIAFDDAYDDSGATTVALQTIAATFARAMIFNDATFDPSHGLTWTVELTSLENNYLQTGVGEDLSVVGNFFGIRFHQSGLLEAFAQSGSVEFDSLGTLAGYVGGAVDLTLRVDPAGYRISTNTGFDSGAKLWSTFSNGYTLAAQNNPSLLWIQVDTSQVSNVGVFDRVRLETVPEPTSLWIPILGIATVALRRSQRHRTHSS